ncbi:MAG TPA: hypothetical protein VFK13_13875 [Gemmatimonadaceae bacterium]|nr:hypothetical protein [Gemmatimonadaceae bacterium]
MWREWRHRRALRARAQSYVRAIVAEPDEAHVRWLAEQGTAGDIDHARWELRYARRALALLVAARDALDDRTASAVAHALSLALADDPAVAPGKVRVAERQLNDRLRAYGEALRNRDGAGSGWHLGRTLLAFAGRRDAVPPAEVQYAAELLATYVVEANQALRERFGTASLPEDVAPSAVRGTAL